MSYKAVIAGASGLIGSTLLQILLNEQDYGEVVILVRKKTGINHPKLKELLVDFSKLNEYANEITGQAIFSCLGTTNIKTPDKVTYTKIDHDYPVMLADLAVKNGVEQFHLISSIGADSKSSAFYLKLKGKTEEDVEAAGIKTLHIYQPSQITGRRKEFRLIEHLSIPLMYLINPLLIGSFKKYRSIPAKTIAMAMFKQSLNNKEGIFVYTSDKIKELA